MYLNKVPYGTFFSKKGKEMPLCGKWHLFLKGGYAWLLKHFSHITTVGKKGKI